MDNKTDYNYIKNIKTDVHVYIKIATHIYICKIKTIISSCKSQMMIENLNLKHISVKYYCNILIK